ncbi:MAG: septation protein SpoVG family protein [Waltera sp.]
MQLEVRIHSIRPSDSIKGTASVNINGAFAVRGIKIIEGSNGLFVSMPSYKAGNEYKDICFPITQECRKQLHDAVIAAYEQSDHTRTGHCSKASRDAGSRRAGNGDEWHVTQTSDSNRNQYSRK